MFANWGGSQRSCTRSLESELNISRADPKDHGQEEAYAACLESLQRLQTDYLDLYLIHWPAKAKLKAEDPRHRNIRKESWTALEKLHKEGKMGSLAWAVSVFSVTPACGITDDTIETLSLQA